MTIFDSIARTFKGSKAPTAAQIAGLVTKADAEVAAAEAEVKAVEARMADAVLGGEAAVASHREATRQAAERLAYSRQAYAVLASKLADAQAQEAEAARRGTYDRAVASQKEAQAALLSRYEPAVAELLRLKEVVAAADELVRIANANLPVGADRLVETESCRDVAAVPERIIGEALIDQWFTTEGGAPVDAERVTRRQGAKGVTYAESSFGPRPIPCELRQVRKVTKQPWCPPVYAARIGDMDLPALMAEPVAAPKPETDLVPVPEFSEAAE
ncbi:hypothetical protein V5F40_09090 [Xanthobacter sp. DSM 14520]|uniref:hypothetical protein n=1 Tax=Xanthobacter autotrophicus (strain ATCC BAA-1158 / Py2) TaxID=78245 RepID=UPI0037267F5C